MTRGGNHPSRRDRYTPARSDSIKTHSPFIPEQFRSEGGDGPLSWIYYMEIFLFLTRVGSHENETDDVTLTGRE